MVASDQQETSNMNVSERQFENEDRYKWMFADVFISNRTNKRPEGMPFITYWKNRRNANIALKQRLINGQGARVLLDTETMDVVTNAEILKDYSSPVVISPVVKKSRKRAPKGLRYAKR